MSMPCPRCSAPLHPRAIDDLEIAACAAPHDAYSDEHEEITSAVALVDLLSMLFR